MNKSRWLAVALLLGIQALFSPAVLADAAPAEWLVFTGSPRAVYFERVIDAAQLRDDRSGVEYLRRLAAAPPAIPLDLTPTMSHYYPSVAASYDALQARLKNAMANRDYATAEQWRVDQAEADLAIVAWELQKGNRASVSFMGKYLQDAAWALNRHIGLNPSIVMTAPVIIRAVTAPPTARMIAHPTSVLRGRSTRLTWQTTGATTASINGRLVALNGEEEQIVTRDADYVLIARGENGNATDKASVTVIDFPTARISALPAQVSSGATTLVSWSTANASTAQINGRNVPPQGSESVVVTVTSQFVIVAVGEGGEATDKATVTVNNFPTASISAFPARIASGATTLVTWSTENATTAQINGRNVPLQGSKNVTVDVNSDFVLVAVSQGGEATDRARVDMLEPPTATLHLSENTIERGQCATLTWQTTAADQIVLNGEAVAPSGNRRVCPEQNENYRLVAVGEGGQAEDRASLMVTMSPLKLYSIHFDFDEWEIRVDAMDTMSQVAALMRQNVDVRMIVNGHTDGRGTEEYNMALGERRAQSVRDYFLAHFGLDPYRFRLESKGEAAPIAPNTTWAGLDNPEGRALNRRAEFIAVR